MICVQKYICLLFLVCLRTVIKKAFKTLLKINTAGKEEAMGKKTKRLTKVEIRSDMLKTFQKSGRLQEINSIKIRQKTR